MKQDGKKALRVGMYLRVSTDAQTILNQRHDLEETAACRIWPGSWSRCTVWVLASICTSKQGVDTTTPSGRAMFHVHIVGAEQALHARVVPVVSLTTAIVVLP